MATTTLTDKQRFEIELEFVQSLSNLSYLEFLAKEGFLNDPSFVNYLRYLQYWKRPEYARFIMYPYCLYFLDVLQDENVRKAFVQLDKIMHFHNQQYYTWRYHYNTVNNQLASASEKTS